VTSFQAVREVRRILGERRVGHAGTLDPAATGLLPICVGQATRLVDYLHQQPKRYHCVLRLGERSTTMDLEGEVSRSGDASAVDAAAVREALARFVGDIEQVPPMHSAVRHDGRHLYELAREGLDVERQPRPVTILEARLLELRPGEVAEAEVDVLCGKGTYMRVLASDVGDALGTGGLLAWLERTAYGPMTVADSSSSRPWTTRRARSARSTWPSPSCPASTSVPPRRSRCSGGSRSGCPGCRIHAPGGPAAPTAPTATCSPWESSRATSTGPPR
jgi:tRNA pseudouridine55 synthase